MFEKAWSKTRARASAAAAVLRKPGFGVASPGSVTDGPEAGPSRRIGGRARRHRPETGAPARRRGRSLAASAFAATVLFALAAGLAAPAQAQSEQTLVSNTGQTRTNSSFTGRQAVPFTTGTNSSGYVLTSVGIHLRDANNPSNIRVRIFTVKSNGEPDSALYTLTNPSSLTGDAINTFTAPTNSTLKPNTTYAVEIGGSSGGSMGPAVSETISTAEDSVRAPVGASGMSCTGLALARGRRAQP